MDKIESSFKELIEEGNIAFYNSAEITNIYLTERSGKSVNIFSLVVFEERNCSSKGETRKNLTKKLIPIDHRKMGISQKRISLDDSTNFFNDLLKSGNSWDIIDGVLEIDDFNIIPKQFIPSFDVPLNNVLKNNNENGSYIIEFFSEKKSLINSPDQKLSEEKYKRLCNEVLNVIPIDLLFLKDRICNVIFQFPTTLISVKTKALDNWDGIELKTAWHPFIILPPPCEFFTYTVFDGNIMGLKTSDNLNGKIENGNIYGDNIQIIKKKKNDLIMWYSNGNYSSGITSNMGIMDYEPRTVDINGKRRKISIESLSLSHIGKFDRDYLHFINKREYEESTKKLIKNKEFLQYGKNGISEKDKARNDLESIITNNCQNGVYIWDPYADAQDILSTVYFCKYSNKKLKVINSYSKNMKRRKTSERQKSNQNNLLMSRIRKFFRCFKPFRSNNTENKFEEWKHDQIQKLKTKSNNKGIDIEIRCKVENYGWNFHDRFLIFPLEKPKVWSLGSSINTLGKDHSILMSVNNPKNVLDAFEYLWDNLDDSILWKYPES